MPFDSENYNPLPIGHQRLLVLAEFLETKVPSERFDLELWAEKSFNPDVCGTVACACGWATTIPEFSALGFSLVNGRKNDGLELRFDGRFHLAAAKHFFNIDDEALNRLFVHFHYHTRPTPGEVAARIRAHVAKEQAALETQSVGAVGALRAA